MGVYNRENDKNLRNVYPQESTALSRYQLSDEVGMLNKISLAIPYLDTIESKSKNELIAGFQQIGRKHVPKDAPLSWVQFKNRICDFKTGEVPYIGYLLGTIAAAVTTYFAISFFINVVKKGKLMYFSLYCFIVGVIAIILS